MTTVPHNDERKRLLILASQASVFLAIGLMVLKMVVWGVSGSVSILASWVDSLMDALASVVNLLAVRLALSPADDDHPFGHTKAESIAGVFQSAFIMGSAIFLCVHSIDKAFKPYEIEHSMLAIWLMVLSIILTLMLVAFQRYVVSKTASIAIRADSLHYVSDLLVNLGVIAALVISMLGFTRADALFGVVIAVYIFYGAVKLCRESLDVLMDKSLPKETLLEIESIVVNHPGVLGMHNLRTHSTGQIKFIQFHIDIEGDLSLFKAHEISQSVEDELMKRFEGADVIIHQDPL